MSQEQARVFVIAGLGYGDEGKGTTVDWLARRYAPAAPGGRTVVVRYNGGAQAAHNVVLPDGTHHTFSQFGSATLAGGLTLLSRYMVANPSTMLVETAALEMLSHPVSIDDPLARVFVDGAALVTTRFHVAANRVRALVKGRAGHGTCGMGVHETKDDAVRGRPSLVVSDLLAPAYLRRKLAEIQRGKLDELNVAYSQAPEYARVQALEDEFSILRDEHVVDVLAERMTRWASRVTIVDGEWLGGHLREPNGLTIFEGAQGVLLDQAHGFFPHVTHSDCTFANADALLDEAGYDLATPVRRYAVTRTYQTRHGAGPMPTTREDLDVLLAHDHNARPSAGPSLATWQGRMRAGELDLVTAMHAVDALGGVDGLVVTHCDVVDPERVPTCVAYELGGSDRVAASNVLTLELLDDARPVIGRMTIHEIAENLCTRVVVTSNGPTHEHKTELT